MSNLCYRGHFWVEQNGQPVQDEMQKLAGSRTGVVSIFNHTMLALDRPERLKKDFVYRAASPEVEEMAIAFAKKIQRSDGEKFLTHIRAFRRAERLPGACVRFGIMGLKSTMDNRVYWLLGSPKSQTIDDFFGYAGTYDPDTDLLDAYTEFFEGHNDDGVDVGVGVDVPLIAETVGQIAALLKAYPWVGSKKFPDASFLRTGSTYLTFPDKECRTEHFEGTIQDDPLRKLEPTCTAPLKVCAVCSIPNTKKKLSLCARCRKTPYCSGNCRKIDWKTHKRTCVYTPDDQVDQVD